MTVVEELIKKIEDWTTLDDPLRCEILSDVQIWLEKEQQQLNELYEFRKQYNAALFNEWAKTNKYDVHKSKKHYDGEVCFGGGWFIVIAMLPSGQISNHYNLKDWDLFNIPEVEIAKYPFDGHTGKDVLERLESINLSK